MESERNHSDNEVQVIRKVPKYKQLQLTEKLAIINLAEQGCMKATIAEQFGVSGATVTRIVQNKEKYQLLSPKKKRFKKRIRVDSGKNVDLEDLLYEWIKQKRSLGIVISGPLIQEKALFFNQQLGGPETFKASRGWLDKFKARFGIRQLSVQGERMSADTEEGVLFKEELLKIIQEGQYPLENVYNADETGLFYKTMPKKTLAPADEQEAPGHKESKERVTIMTCANATGSHKIPLLLIGKSQHPRCFKGITNLSLSYRGQTNAWMNEYMCRVYYELNILGKNYTDMNITQYYEALMKLNMESEIAAIAKAMYLKKTDNLIPAREILKDILLVKPYSVHGWIILSEINMRLYCWNDAENAIRQALNSEKYTAEDDLFYEMELILMEAMSRTNNKYKWEIASQMCENHLGRHHSTRLELIHIRIGVLLNDCNIYNKLSNLESQCQIKIEVNILRALYLKQHKQLEEAANALDSTLETSEAWLLLGLIYWEMAEYNYSLMAFLNGIKVDRYNWECLAYLGDYYRKYGMDMERSRRCYQTALQINPNSEQAGIGLSTVYRHLKDQDANIQLLQRLTMKDSGPKWAWLQLGLQYLDHGDALQAIKAFQRVIRANPNDSRSWELLADAYIVRGAHTSALKSYQRALELCTTSLYSMLQLANIKLIIGQYSEAKKDFEHILASEPNCVPALKGLVKTCLALAKENIAKQFLGRANDNLQQAMDSLTIAIIEHNDMSCIWKLLGDTCWRAALMPEKYCYLKVQSILLTCGDTKYTTLIKRPDLFLLSIRCYCCALSMSPQSALLWHDLASCYLMQLHLDPLVEHKTLAGKCIGAAKHAVTLSPSMWLHWNLLGVICMSPYIKNYALAQHAYIMASDKDLNNAVVWSNLGTLYLYIGNLYKANEAYSQAQRADPAYINSWIGQALIAEMMSRKDAMDLFRHSTQLGYHDQAAVGYTHWVLTVLLNSSTKKDSLYTYMIENMHATYVAADVMNWYIEHHPDDYYARNAYGLLLERQQLYKSAAKQFTAAVCLSRNEEKDLACINLARVLIQLKKYSEAVKLCRAVKGNNYNSQCHLAMSLLKDAQYEDSYTAYEAALRLFANTEIEKAYTLCAMAAIAYTYQGVNDAKTLLFQCIRVQPPIIAAFLAAASLGILHGDLNLTTLVLNELKPYENNPEYGLHVANLSAYFHLIGNNTKSAVATLSKATFRHPGDVRYWVQLLKVLLQTDLQAFNMCAQKTLFLSRNIAGTNVIHVACASSLSYFAQNLDTNSSRSIQKLLFTYPSHVESWATFIAAFLPRSVNMDSTWSVQWISVLTSIILNYQCTDSMVKWLCDSKQKLTQFI